jgi:hypothetical protein
MYCQPWIAEASQLEFRIIHYDDRTDWFGAPGDGDRDRRPNDDSLNGPLVSPAGEGKVHGLAATEVFKSHDNLNSPAAANPKCACLATRPLAGGQNRKGATEYLVPVRF